MMQVQVAITLTEDAHRVQIDVLSREDATDAEREIAHAIEQMVFSVVQQVAQEGGESLAVEYIGEQHAEAAALAEVTRERDELRALARMALERLYDAHGRDGHYVYKVIRAVENILRRAEKDTPQ
jgi:hypothetical protein